VAGGELRDAQAYRSYKTNVSVVGAKSWGRLAGRRIAQNENDESQDVTRAERL